MGAGVGSRGLDWTGRARSGTAPSVAVWYCLGGYAYTNSGVYLPGGVGPMKSIILTQVYFSELIFHGSVLTRTLI